MSHWSPRILQLVINSLQAYRAFIETVTNNLITFRNQLEDEEALLYTTSTTLAAPTRTSDRPAADTTRTSPNNISSCQYCTNQTHDERTPRCYYHLTHQERLERRLPLRS